MILWQHKVMSADVSWTRTTDDGLVALARAIPNLKHLRAAECESVTDIGVQGELPHS